MALNWQYDSKTWDSIKDENGINDAIVWATMIVGFNSITKANYEEFYKRLALYEALHGAWLNAGGEPHYFTLEDIKKRIGLKTNASTFSRTEFIRRQTKQWFADDADSWASGNWKSGADSTRRA